MSFEGRRCPNRSQPSCSSRCRCRSRGQRSGRRTHRSRVITPRRGPLRRAAWVIPTQIPLSQPSRRRGAPLSRPARPRTPGRLPCCRTRSPGPPARPLPPRPLPDRPAAAPCPPGNLALNRWTSARRVRQPTRRSANPQPSSRQRQRRRQRHLLRRYRRSRPRRGGRPQRPTVLGPTPLRPTSLPKPERRRSVHPTVLGRVPSPTSGPD